MKKFLLVSVMAILLMGLIACSGGKSLIGKWSVDATSGGLYEGEQVIVEFKNDGSMVMDDIIDGASQGVETLYYKMVDEDTIWWCTSAEECTEEFALVVDFTIVNGVLTLTPPDYPDEPLILNRVP